MTSKDVMDGGADPLSVDPGLFHDGDARYHDPAGMRTIVGELQDCLAALQGVSTGDGLLADCGLTTAQMGTWNDAAAFCATAGNHSRTKFAEVHQFFTDALKDVIAALETSTDTHARTDKVNEGKG